MPFNAEYDVCIICFTEQVSSDARTLNLARTLVKNNKSVAIIGIGDENDAFNLKKEGISLFLLNKFNSKKSWKRWLNFAIQAKKYFKQIKPAITLAGDFYALYSASKLKKLSGSKLFYDSREIYSALGPLSNNPLKQKIITSFERYLLKNVDEVIVSGELDAQYLKEFYNLTIPFHTIMNLPPYCDKIESNIIRERFPSIADKKIIIYQGMLMKGRGLSLIVKSLPFIEDAALVICGEGNYSDELKELSKNLNVAERTIFTGKLPYDQLTQWTAAADLGIALIQPVSLSYKLALPNKLFEYCLARIPSLSSSLPAINGIIEKFQIGETVPYNSTPEEVAGSIRDILKNKEYYVKNCELHCRELSYGSQENKIIEIFS